MRKMKALGVQQNSWSSNQSSAASGFPQFLCYHVSLDSVIAKKLRTQTSAETELKLPIVVLRAFVGQNGLK